MSGGGRKGFSVHVTFDVMGVETKEEAQAKITGNLPRLEGVKVSQIQVGKYTITDLADKYKDLL